MRPAWSVLIAYLGVSLLHGAYDSFGGITGYIVISIIGLVPLVYLWWRGDRRAQNAAAVQTSPQVA
jgi:membrane protein DedA with SNARE-associated domain